MNNSNEIINNIFEKQFGPQSSGRHTPLATPTQDRDADKFVENATAFLQNNGLNNLLYNPKQQIEIAMGGFLGNSANSDAANKDLLSNMEKLERIE